MKWAQEKVFVDEIPLLLHENAAGNEKNLFSVRSVFHFLHEITHRQLLRVVRSAAFSLFPFKMLKTNYYLKHFCFSTILNIIIWFVK